MSSLRNAVSRRAHKERAQPESRKKFGLLEKHKDCVEHAKAHHKEAHHIKRKTAGSYRELKGGRKRVNELEKIYMDMAMQKELQAKYVKDEIVCPTSNAVCKWRAERKR